MEDRSKITDVTAMVMEKWQRLCNGDWPIVVSALQQFCMAKGTLTGPLQVSIFNALCWPGHIVLGDFAVQVLRERYIFITRKIFI